MNHLPPSLIVQRVYDHLLAQGRRSSRPDINCAYRGDDNTRCAIGVFISDDVYSPVMERKDVRQLASLFPSIADMLGPHLDLADELQIIHDDLAIYRDDQTTIDPHRLAVAFIELANHHSLEFRA